MFSLDDGRWPPDNGWNGGDRVGAEMGITVIALFPDTAGHGTPLMEQSRLLILSDADFQR